MIAEEESSLVLEKPTETSDRNNANSNRKFIAAAYAGPLPLSSELKNYEMIVPGAGERILKMAENESLHRQCIESKVVDVNIKLANRKATERLFGQSFAFIIAMTCIVAGIYFIAVGRSTAGTLFSGSGLASVLVVFYSNKILKFIKKKKNKQ